jgi:hypothetical protein
MLNIKMAILIKMFLEPKGSFEWVFSSLEWINETNKTFREKGIL